MDKEPDVGWKCAIKGPVVGEAGRNMPNLASPMVETIVTVRRWIWIRIRRYLMGGHVERREGQ